MNEFEPGDSVYVEASPDDDFHSFQGTVKTVDGLGYVVVEDQDGDCWDVDPIQVLKD